METKNTLFSNRPSCVSEDSQLILICLLTPVILACFLGLVFCYIGSIVRKGKLYFSRWTKTWQFLLHLYCQHCAEKHLAEIWRKYPDKLPKEKSMNLFYNWDQLGRNQIDIDILGCLVSYKPGKVVNNKMRNWFY